jgi:hypothetical protein
MITMSAMAGQSGTWGRYLAASAVIQDEHPSGVPLTLFQTPAFITATGDFATTALWTGAGICLAITALLWLQRRSRIAVYVVAGLAVVELVWFALGYRPVFDLDEAYKTGFHSVRAKFKEDVRYTGFGLDYNADSGGYNMGGYDPYILKRYAEFIDWTQGNNPDKSEAYLYINNYSPLYRMLRLQYGMGENNGKVSVEKLPTPLPHALLVPRFKVAHGRDAIFDRLSDTDFDPTREVVLESEPQIKPAGGPAGTARVVASDSDSLTIEAETPTPQILLITDGYSRHWRALALPGSTQHEYQLQPANYVLRAVPLSAGKHRLRIEYSPAAFRLGAWVSGVSWLVFAGASLFALRTWRRGRRTVATGQST